MTRAWDKEKIWVPDGNQTYDLPYTGRAVYPLSRENSWRARLLNWVNVWHVSCILLGHSYVEDVVVNDNEINDGELLKLGDKVI